VLAFSYTYRTLLRQTGIVAIETANVQITACDDILACREKQSVDPLFTEQMLDEHSYAAHLPTLSSYVEHVCSYIAGFVVR